MSVHISIKKSSHPNFSKSANYCTKYRGNIGNKTTNLTSKKCKKIFVNNRSSIKTVFRAENAMKDKDIYSPNFQITNPIMVNLGKIERASGFLNGIQVSDEWIKKMQERALILEAHHTTHIEGTELSLDESYKILKGEEITNVRTDDVKELKNYRIAFDQVAKYIRSQYPLTEALIREIHKSLVIDVRGNSATPGEYRKI